MDENRIRRFSAWRIVEHWVFTMIFAVLVVTGLAQKFYTLDISMWVIFRLGGIDYLRLVHRYAGIACLAVTALHAATALACVASGRWRPSMAITGKDFSDVVRNIKYYLGIKGRPALCDRYNYRQKFEYWGVLLSAFIMVATGLVLWFPIFFTRFLPGDVIPAAQVMHTNHGLLILLIIALWHIYNSIFSPEVFPVDPGMFTGHISRERMVREHPAELARIEGKTIHEIIEEYNDTKIRERLDLN
ncbi:MAG: cytochrome b/b6 domain-containing protein [Nitrospirae bacterium]|nr:cytochrome b/b6 domain-containing protein [Nitrospirota bacterium]